MNVIGLVCEYNPLHNGHIYQINKIKEMYPDSIIITCLNGYFMERGEVSYLTKENKVKASLNNNIDIVVELPFIYGSQSADTFSYHAIKILNELNIDTLVFGSESNDIDNLKKIALMQENDDFNNKVLDEMDKGISYPQALKNVLNIDYEILPNDLLGISYIKAINKINKNINAVSIKRTSEYHDTLSNDNIISALNIRNKFDNNEDISKYTPVYNLVTKVDHKLLFKLIKSKILTDDNLDTYVDVNEGIEFRLKKYINESNNLKEYIELIKTKRYSFNKINRMLIHILLGFKKEDNIDINNIRILGFNNNGKNYLNKFDIDTTYNKLVKDYELKASLIYDLLTESNTYLYELKNIPIIKDTD